MRRNQTKLSANQALRPRIEVGEHDGACSYECQRPAPQPYGPALHSPVCPTQCLHSAVQCGHCAATLPPLQLPTTRFASGRTPAFWHCLILLPGRPHTQLLFCLTRTARAQPQTGHEPVQGRAARQEPRGHLRK